ncbi:MAG TPA: hypothetical protein VGB37_15365 [Candidatus Lokiarchaeia archaeon]
MSDNITEYNFKFTPKEIVYYDREPLKLNNELSFFHNKNIFRKEINKLQYTFKNYTGNSLVASGIRDSYLKEEFSENVFLILLTNNIVVKTTNNIIEKAISVEVSPKCFYLETDSNYMLLLTKEMESLIFGIDTMNEVFVQTFENYYAKKNFEDYIKIRPFKIIGCLQNS